MSLSPPEADGLEADGLEAAALEADCAAPGLSPAIIAGVAVACVLFGFVLGARGRRLATAAKALLSSLSKAGAGEKADKDSLAAAADGGADDNDMEGEDEQLEYNNIDLADFLSNRTDPGLDLHPELEVNPVLTYQIALAKEAARREKAINALKLEGLTDEEAEDRMFAEEMTKGGGKIGASERSSALQVLISHGARVTSVRQGASAEQAILDNLKRQKRTIDVFLGKTRGIETAFSKPEEQQAGRMQKEVSAAAKAVDTKLNRHGGASAERAKCQVRQAAQARVQLAAVNKVLLREGKIRGPEMDESGERRGGHVLDPTDLESLAHDPTLAAVADDDAEDGDDVSGEGEEGDDDDELAT